VSHQFEYSIYHKGYTEDIGRNPQRRRRKEILHFFQCEYFHIGIYHKKLKTRFKRFNTQKLITYIPYVTNVIQNTVMYKS